MDRIRSIETEQDCAVADAPRGDSAPAADLDERRMHVRAYNYWVSLLDGRAYPSIEDLDPASLHDFGEHSVLIDFTAGPENPAIPFLGKALREESGHDAQIVDLAHVPQGSLLSRLTDHHLQIIANRAPIGFEAEFVNRRGRNTLYRGILMPFSSDDDTIDFIYGVINWKEATDSPVAELVAEVEQALHDPAMPDAPAWADGPRAARRAWPANDFNEDDEDDAPAELDEDAGLGDRLAAARDGAALLRAAHGRTRAALYRALGLAYDFALLTRARPAEYAEMLADSGIRPLARSPMTPVAKLVFGADYDKTRLAEFATALGHGLARGIGLGAFRDFLTAHEGGLKGVVTAERAARRPAAKPSSSETARGALRTAAARGLVDIGPVDDEFVLLVARREADGAVAVLAPVADPALLDRAIRKVAGR